MTTLTLYLGSGMSAVAEEYEFGYFIDAARWNGTPGHVNVTHFALFHRREARPLEGGARGACVISQVSPGRKNAFGLDDKSRYDFFLSATHAALFQDGQLIVESDIPAGSFPWSNVPLKAYYSHYLYHSDQERQDLETVVISGQNMCYPLNSFWFNEAIFMCEMFTHQARIVNSSLVESDLTGSAVTVSRLSPVSRGSLSRSSPPRRA
jgi:hypothetical protein